MATVTLSGKVAKFGLGKHPRRYFTVDLPYAEAVKVYRSRPYSGLTGEGEQRALFPAHVKRLKRAMNADDFTPRAIEAGLTPEQKDRLELHGNEATLTVEGAEFIPLLDGQHGLAALTEIYAAAGPDTKKVIEAQTITALVLIDNDPRRDFANLQMGRSVDAAHMNVMKIQEGILNDPSMPVALDTAKILNQDETSPWHNDFRFDSYGEQMPVSTILAKGASDLTYSVVGGAKIAMAHGKDAAWLAAIYVAAFRAIQNSRPKMLDSDMILSYPAYTKGGVTLQIAVGNMLAALCLLKKQDEPTEEDFVNLVVAAEATLHVPRRSNLSNQHKREFVANFARELFYNLKPEIGKEKEGIEFIDDYPAQLVKCLSYSALGLQTPKGKRGRPSKDKTTETTETQVSTETPTSTEAAPHVEGEVPADTHKKKKGNGKKTLKEVSQETKTE